MTDKVTPIRSLEGKFVKGVSGNPQGVSAKEAAIKQMQRQNDVLLTTMITEMVPAAAKLHKALLRDKGLTTKEAIHLLELTYKYGIGTPRQAEPKPKAEEEQVDYGEWSQEKIDAIKKMLDATAKDAGGTDGTE